MDPKLFDLLWEIHTELGSQKPIHLISGFRSKKTNSMLRKKRGGQAKNSRHILGKAADVHFPDVPVRRLRYSALVRERGGVGYYPTSAIPFVHVDTGRVRHWPRMGRYELALLFPKGRSKHRPRGGGPITKRDVETAQRKYAKLAERVLAFHELRAKPRQSVLVAEAKPSTAPIASAAPTVPAPSPNKARNMTVPKPVLAGLGTPVNPIVKLFKENATAQRPLPPPSSALGLASRTIPLEDNPEEDYAPVQLASADPIDDLIQASRSEINHHEPDASRRGGDGTFFEPTGWANAPRYDPDHHSELSYRPFPIGPVLNEDASINDPALSRLIHPDFASTRNYIDIEVRPLPLRFKPGIQFAEMLWSDLFAGSAVTNILSAEFESGGRRGTRVRTAAR